jgi:hypothetical protein
MLAGSFFSSKLPAVLVHFVQSPAFRPGSALLASLVIGSWSRLLQWLNDAEALTLDR